MTEARRFSCFFRAYKAMNKRQKKKREKKILLWELERNKPKIERYGIDFNYEGYRDPTAAAAIRAMESKK